MKLNHVQMQFIKCACNLREAIFNFGISDVEFKVCYGFSKEEAHEECDTLYLKLKKETKSSAANKSRKIKK